MGSQRGSGAKLGCPCEDEYRFFRWLTSGLPLGAAACGRIGLGRRLIGERARRRGLLLACGANTEGAKLSGRLIIHGGASCFPSFRTTGQLNCLWINSSASYWLHLASEEHLNTRNPIMPGRDGGRGTGGASANPGALPISSLACVVHLQFARCELQSHFLAL